MKKKVITLLLFTVLCATGYTQNAGDFKTDGKGTITYYNGKEKDIVIPEQIDGVAITAIGHDAFYEMQLTSITIGADVELAIDSFIVYNDGYSLKGSSIGFEEAYFDGGKQAGTYTRPNANSKEWTRKQGTEKASGGLF